MKIRKFQSEDIEAVVEIWQQCDLVKSWNDPYKDIQRKLDAGADLFLVGEFGGTVVATVMGGFDGHRGWINYLAVAPDHSGNGYGRRLMEDVEKRLLELGCPKINLQVRNSNCAAISFYKHIGFLEDDSVGLGKRLIADD